MNLQTFTLEVSLKPFLRQDAPMPEIVAETIFTQWQAASADAESLAVQLWVGDGSEILDFTGDLDACFDWSRYIGIMNREPRAEDREYDPKQRSAFRGMPFEAGTAPVSYRFLKDLIATLKETGRRVCGKPVQIGTIFDPGPEFTVSEFKYERHRELLLGGYPDSRKDVVSCYARLRADNRFYAGFPEGIPEGTSFGTFLGRQLRCFSAALDYDFIWFSNGFGFGNFPWSYPGVLFDGEQFHPEQSSQVAEEMLEFWRAFRAECSLPVVVRGTNLSTGRDLACDGVPLREIYREANLTAPPVNSPWSALNWDYGSEMTGFLSHIAGFPTMDFTFRFYVHDPWFITKPWLHNYESSSWDIHLMMAAGRLDAQGKLHNPSRINILTVDDCRGDLPEQAALEVTPELRRAMTNAPDAPGALVWLYPFEEYSDLLRDAPERIGEIFAGDHFIRDAVNLGLPLSTVVSTRDMSGLPPGRMILTPIPVAGTAWEDKLFELIESGEELLCYGPLDHASERFRGLLGITLDEPLEEDFEVDESGRHIRHRAVLSGGGIREFGGYAPLFQLRQGTALRTLAARSGGVVWLRTSAASCDAFSVHNEYLGITPREDLLAPAGLLLTLLGQFGWSFRYECGDDGFPPFSAWSMHRNGFLFAGYNRTSTTGQQLRFPFGAPAPTGCDFELKGGYSCFRFPASWQHECRVFIESGEDGVVSCHRRSSYVHGLDNWLLLRGLRKARINLFLPPGAERTLELQLPQPGCFDNAANAPVVGFEKVELPGYCFFRSTEEITGTLRICY